MFNEIKNYKLKNLSENSESTLVHFYIQTYEVNYSKYFDFSSLYIILNLNIKNK